MAKLFEGLDAARAALNFAQLLTLLPDDLPPPQVVEDTYVDHGYGLAWIGSGGMVAISVDHTDRVLYTCKSNRALESAKGWFEMRDSFPAGAADRIRQVMEVQHG